MRILKIAAGLALLLHVCAASVPAVTGDPEDLLNAARELSLKGRFSDSRRLYQKLIEEYPANVHDQALFWLAYTFEAEGSPAEAVDLYRELTAKYPAGTYADDALRKLANIFLRQGDLPAAAEALRTLTSAHPGSPFATPALLELGDLYGYRLGEFEKALAIYRDYRPDGPAALEVQWKMRFFEGNLDQSGQPLRTYLRAREQRLAGNLEAAEATIRGLLKESPRAGAVDDALVLLGRIEIDRAVRLRRSQPILGAGDKERFLRHYRDAGTYFRQILRDYPAAETAAEAQYALGLIQDWDALGGLNNFQEARKEYQTVLDRHPGTYWAQQAKERLDTMKNIF